MNYYRDYYNYMNNNYNIPDYNQNENKNNLFDPYQGFIRGNMFKDLYNSYKSSKPVEVVPKNEQASMLTTIDCLNLALIDLGLYLDLHPDDLKMLEKFNKYRVDLNEYTYEYQKKYGPLCLNNDSLKNSPFGWIKSPWPWESVK